MLAPLCRRALLRLMPLAAVPWRPPAATASDAAATASEAAPAAVPALTAVQTIDPLLDRLRNRYILLRPGETTFEAAGIVDSNPINKQSSERGLTERGRAQVRRSAAALLAAGVDSPIIFHDSGARASQTADEVAGMLSVPRNRVEPEFRFLEARGLGAFDGSLLSAVAPRMRALDALDSASGAPESDDGTPSDSVDEIFVRMRQTVLKVENSYSGSDVIIVAGDGAVLSAFAAAACGIDMREHGRFELPPGGYYDLPKLRRAVKAGEFRDAELAAPTEESLAAGQAVLREMGSRMFADTAAGSWVLGPGVRR